MNEEIKDFHVTVRLRNNQLYARRQAMGMTQADVATAVGYSQSAYGAYECLRAQPYNRRGEIKGIALKISEYFGESIATLWPEAVRAVVNSCIERTIDGEDMLELVGDHTRRLALPPDELYEQKEGEEKLRRAMLTLTDREQEIIERRFGMNDGEAETLRSVGDGEGITSTRIRQIECKALRKLRHSSRSKHLKEYVAN